MNKEFSEFEDYNDDIFIDETADEAVMSFVKTSSKVAAKLTKLIVENNRHNSIKMSTDDIYVSYNQSFEVVMATIAKYGLSE